VIGDESDRSLTCNLRPKHASVKSVPGATNSAVRDELRSGKSPFFIRQPDGLRSVDLNVTTHKKPADEVQRRLNAVKYARGRAYIIVDGSN